MHRKDTFTAAVEDFFTKKVAFVTFVSAVLTLGIMFLISYIAFGQFHQIADILVKTYNWLNEQIHALFAEYSFLSFFFKKALLQSVSRYVIIALVTTLIYYAFFFLYTWVVSFLFTGYLVKMVAKKHYRSVKMKGMGVLRTIVFYIKTYTIGFLLLILISPVLLVPGLNLLFFLVPYYIFHKSIVYDVSSVINDVTEYKKIKKVNWTELKGVTALCFAMVQLPIIGIFLYPLYVIFVAHYVIRETIELRSVAYFSTAS